MIVVDALPDTDFRVAMREVKAIAAAFPGDEQIAMHVGARTLLIGDPWKVDGSPGCVARLEELGEVSVEC